MGFGKYGISETLIGDELKITSNNNDIIQFVEDRKFIKEVVHVKSNSF